MVLSQRLTIILSLFPPTALRARVRGGIRLALRTPPQKKTQKKLAGGEMRWGGRVGRRVGELMTVLSAGAERAGMEKEWVRKGLGSPKVQKMGASATVSWSNVMIDAPPDNTHYPVDDTSPRVNSYFLTRSSAVARDSWNTLSKEKGQKNRSKDEWKICTSPFILL